MKTIQEFFSDWVEPDDAMYFLACHLGIMEYHEQNTAAFFEYYPKVKSVFAVKTGIGTILFEILEKMVEGGLLEKNEDWEFRWNKSFKPYWEGGKYGH